MELRQQLETALHQSMKDHNDLAKNTIRLILSSVKLSEIDKGRTFEDSEILTVLQKELKIRQESIEEYRKGGRTDLIEKAEGEILVLNTFLPKQLSDTELIEEVKKAIAEVSAQSPADMGMVMKVIIPRLQGKVSSDRISHTVRSLLQ